MADDVLRIQTAVDIAPLQSLMPQAASAVEQATGRMSSAFKDAQNASRAATAELGGIGKGLGSVSEAAHGAGFNIRYAFLGLKDAAEGRYKFALAELANELVRMGGTTLAIGLVAGAIAGVGYAAYEVHKKLEELAEQPHKIDQAFHGLDTTLQTSIDELDNENARLSVTIAKLEGKPENLLEVALTDAYLAADKLNEELEKVFEKLDKILKENAPGIFDTWVMGVKGTDDIKEYIGQYQRLMKDTNYAGSQNVHRVGNTPEQVKAAQDQWTAAIARIRAEAQDKIGGWIKEAMTPPKHASGMFDTQLLAPV
jgi:hypothetical protein